MIVVIGSDDGDIFVDIISDDEFEIRKQQNYYGNVTLREAGGDPNYWGRSILVLVVQDIVK